MVASHDQLIHRNAGLITRQPPTKAAADLIPRWLPLRSSSSGLVETARLPNRPGTAAVGGDQGAGPRLDRSGSALLLDAAAVCS
jgi:hypothetical protein